MLTPVHFSSFLKRCLDHIAVSELLSYLPNRQGRTHFFLCSLPPRCIPHFFFWLGALRLCCQDLADSPPRLCAWPLRACVALSLPAQPPHSFVPSFATSSHAPCFVIPPSLLIRHLSHISCFLTSSLVPLCHTSLLLILLTSFLVFIPRPHKAQSNVDFCSVLTIIWTRQTCPRCQDLTDSFMYVPRICGCQNLADPTPRLLGFVLGSRVREAG